MAKFFTDFRDNYTPGEWADFGGCTRTVVSTGTLATEQSEGARLLQLSGGFTASQKLTFWQIDNQSANMDVVARFQFASDSSAFYLGARATRHSDSLLSGYYAEIITGAGGVLALRQCINGAVITVGSAASLDTSANTWYTMRLQVSGTTIRVKLWGEFEVEPTAWRISATDAGLTTGGHAFVGYHGNNHARSIDFMGVGTSTDEAPQFWGAHTAGLLAPSGYPQILGTATFLNTASSSTYTIPLPSGVPVGGRLVLILSIMGTATVDVPAGWTSVLNALGHSSMRLAIFTREMPTPVISSVTVTFGSVLSVNDLRTLAYGLPACAQPFVATPVISSGANITYPTATPAGAKHLFLAVSMSTSSGTPTRVWQNPLGYHWGQVTNIMPTLGAAPLSIGRYTDGASELPSVTRLTMSMPYIATVVAIRIANVPPAAPTNLARSNNGGQPTLSWTFNDPDTGDAQSAYQAICERWNGSAWVAHFDTGKVASATSSHALTVGQRLSGATTYRFRVKAWDVENAEGPYSANFSWDTTTDVYQATGSYTTEVIQLNRGGFVRNGSLSWTQATSADTSLAVSLRTTGDGVTWTGWSAIASPHTLSPVAAIQLKFDMATSYNLSTPTFSGISVSFPQEYNETSSYLSPALNVGASVIDSYGGQAAVTSTIPAGTSVVSEYAGSVNGITWGAWTAFPVAYHPYMKYRITLNTNASRDATPTLSTVATTFWTKYEAQGSLLTPPISFRDYVVTSLIPSWSSAPNSGTIQVESAASEDNVTWGPWLVATAAAQLPERGAFVRFRITLASDSAGRFTPTMSSMSVAAIASAFRGFWQSPILDVSNATSQDSGIASMVQSTPGASRVLMYSRSSPNQEAWTPWVSATAQGELQHPAGDYVELLVQLDLGNTGERPSLYRLAVSFDGEASAQLLSDQFSPGGQFHFAQLLDYAVITNGIDAPRKYDGGAMTELGGEPPRGFFVAAHKNRMWMLRGSRLYFTELIDIENWPILNFIDISPNDGDEGTALYPSGDFLIIAKKHSIWLLVGDSYDTFSVRRLSAARGCIAPRSITMMDEILVFVSDDGIYFSDFAQTVLASERLRKTWDTLNHRRLNQAVSWFAKQKLYISLPSAGQPVNDTVLVYDALRKAWYVMPKWNVSCATSWVEAGQQAWLVGHSNEGQVSQIDIGRNNNGNPIEGLWESRYFDARMPEIVKRFRQAEIMVAPAIQPVALEVQFCQDGGEYSAPVTVTVPGRHDRRTEVLQLDPARSGIFYGRSIGMRIRQVTMDAGVGIVAVNLSFYPLQERPTVRS